MNNKKTIVVRTVSTIGFLTLIIIMLAYISKVVQPKDYINTYQPFFEDAEQMDVLMFGTSHVACDISPMYLWNRYGITSYNFGNSGEPIPVTYWVMKLAFEYHTPKVAIVDVGAYTCGEKYNGYGVNDSHLSFDAFPISGTKIEAVNDLIDERNTRIEYLFTAGLYHDRWDRLSKSDFIINPSKQKGTWAYGNKENYFIAKSGLDFEILDDIKEYDEEFPSKLYLRKIIELCMNEGVLPILVANPYVCSADEQAYINSVKILSQEYGIPFINIMHQNAVVDLDTDMMDGEHTNPSGMNKISDYLGNALSLVVADHRGEAGYENWDTDYEEFLTLKNETLQGLKDYKSVLEFISDEDYVSHIYICEKSMFWEDEQNIKLLQNVVRSHIIDNSGVKSKDINLLGKAGIAKEEGCSYYLEAEGAGEIFKELVGEEIPKEEIRDDAIDLHVVVFDKNQKEVITDKSFSIKPGSYEMITDN